MAANIMNINGHYNSSAYKEYLCDSIDDIQKLPKFGVYGSIDDSSDFSINEPCAIGSTALVCDNGSGASAVYILNPSNKWTIL